MAGERCDVETLEWSKKVFRVPVLDHWWQTGEHIPCTFINIAEMLKKKLYKDWRKNQPQTRDSGGSGFNRNKQFFDYPVIKNIAINDTNTAILLVPGYEALSTFCFSSLFPISRKSLMSAFPLKSLLDSPCCQHSHCL